MAASDTPSERSTPLQLPEHPGGYETVNPPIVRGSTVLYKRYEDFQATGREHQFHGRVYGTFGSPTQLTFEEVLCQMEGGYATRCFQSGIAAITNTLMAYTQQGDHILLAENVYGPTRYCCMKILPKFGITTTLVPGDVAHNITDYWQANTRLVFLESPGSNTLEIQDVPAICAIAHQKGVPVVMDNTWATPLYFDALAHGVDVVIQSVTKYISGHSDVLMGTVTTNEAWFDPLNRWYDALEIFVSPEEAYLAYRGLQTLRTRLEAHSASAMALAQWLETHPAVDRVIHPRLEQHPQHGLWKRDFTGASGLFSFTLKNTLSDGALCEFINRLEHFAIGLSWGGYQSLVKGETIGTRTHDCPYVGKTLIRLNIGLEPVETLRQDLQQALDTLI